MVKKLCLAVGAVIVGLVVISVVPGLSSLAKVKWNDLRSTLERQVPPETQLKQLQVEIDAIDKDIKRNLGKLAAQEVDAERLEASLTAMKDGQGKLRDEVASMTKALDSKEQRVVFNSRNYRPSELALKLEAAVNTYEGRKAEIKAKDQLVNSKRQSLELAHQQITKMQERKLQLQATVANLETRIQTMRLKQVDSPIELNDSQVNKCNAIADRLDKILSEEEKKTELFHRYGYESNNKVDVSRETKTTDEVVQAAKKALQDDEDKNVVDGK